MYARREVLKGAAAVALGVGGWFSAGPAWMGDAPEPTGPAPSWVEALASHVLAPWEGGSAAGLVAARRMNPEYDLMARMFTALALGDLAARSPDRWRRRALAALDAIADDTRAEVDAHGPGRFLLGYWTRAPWKGAGGSLFVDGERLMVGAIRLGVADEPRRREGAVRLADRVAASLLAGPIGAAESYPDECWTFCNALAVAALSLLRPVGGGRWDDAIAAFRESARGPLVGPGGMLVSSFTWEGRVCDGPEGSSVWPAVHFLGVVDPKLAAEQYALARAALGRTALGFGWSREWAGPQGAGDIDSGPIVPVVGASAGASGLAILAARSQGDDAYAQALLAALDLAALPREAGGRRSYGASNAVGDAVLLAALTAGPTWAAARGV